MESPIMARFSSSVVPSAAVTWKSQDLPKMVDDRRAGLDEGLQIRILLGADAGAAGRPEGADLRRLEHGALDALEEAQVLRVRAGPAALDVVDAHGVEPMGDPDLVLHREGDALALAAVAEGGVVELDEPCHGAPMM